MSKKTTACLGWKSCGLLDTYLKKVIVNLKLSENHQYDVAAPEQCDPKQINEKIFVQKEAKDTPTLLSKVKTILGSGAHFWYHGLSGILTD